MPRRSCGSSRKKGRRSVSLTDVLLVMTTTIFLMLLSMAGTALIAILVIDKLIGEDFWDD